MNIINSITLGWRRLKADKVNTFISLTGLVLGLGIIAVVLVFALDELC